MNLLVIGRYPQIPGFFQTLAGQADQNVAFCPSECEAIDYFRRSDRGIDWIFFVAVPRDEVMKMIRRLRNEGITSPAIMCQTAEPADADAPLAPVLVGLFERSTAGGRLLGCNFVEKETAPGGGLNYFEDEILFEYHEPCAAGKGR